MGARGERWRRGGEGGGGVQPEGPVRGAGGGSGTNSWMCWGKSTDEAAAVATAGGRGDEGGWIRYRMRARSAMLNSSLGPRGASVPSRPSRGRQQLWDDGGAKARDCMSRFTRPRRSSRRQSPCSAAVDPLFHLCKAKLDSKQLLQAKKEKLDRNYRPTLDCGHDQTCSAKRAASLAESMFTEPCWSLSRCHIDDKWAEEGIHHP